VTILTERPHAEDESDREVEVVRRIERGAGSAYRINGRDVRAKDVSLMFADAATGAHSPALVSQGRISAVIAAKPAERRQMLEEAAGIAGLHVRRKDAEQKLRAAETNLSRLDDVLADMEQRANALRRQARAAERYRQLSEEIRLAEARLIFARWRDAAAAADAAKLEAVAAEEAVTVAAEAQRGTGGVAGAGGDRARRCARRRAIGARSRGRRWGTGSPACAPNAPRSTAASLNSPSSVRRWSGIARVRIRWRSTPPPRSPGWTRRTRRSPRRSPPPRASAVRSMRG
jgi:chromosome segregation protein